MPPDREPTDRPRQSQPPQSPDDDRHRKPLANIEAEQALLGTILFANEAFHQLPEGLARHSFYEPFHGRLFEEIATTIGVGLLADPYSLGQRFRANKAFVELGGIGYLAELVDKAPPAANAPHYARVIIDLSTRRDLVALAAEMSARADDGLEGGADQIIALAESALLSMQLHAKTQGLITLGTAVDRVMAYVDNRDDDGGVFSGLQPLDLQTGPMLGGDLILGAGRPSMGKSAVGLAIALNIAAPIMASEMNGYGYDPRRKPAGVIELHGEMSFGDERTGGQTVRRHIADLGFALYGPRFPTYKAIREKAVSDEQRAMMWEVAQRMRSIPIEGVKRTGLTLANLRSIVRRKASEWARDGIPLGMVLIDHVGLLRVDGRMSRYEAQTELAIGMKELAGEIGAPILALVQLSREVERRDDKRPQLSDLRDSGAWEENADVVWLAYRDAYYAAREAEPDQGDGNKWYEWDKRKRSKEIELIMAKIREGDAGNTAKVWGQLAWNAIRGAEPDLPGGALI